MASPGLDAPDTVRTANNLVQTLRDVVAHIPGGPHRPTPLSARLGLSRVTISKLLTSIERPSTLEAIESIPGPESLRAIVDASAGLGVEDPQLRAAHQAIDSFAALIRDHYGTRAAMHAAIGGRSSTLRARVEHAGRSDVFKGMAQVLGVEAQSWLTTMFFAPSRADEETVSVSTLHGALGVRRLRVDTPVYFTFGPPVRDAERELSTDPIVLEDLYANEPANLKTTMLGGQLRHELIQESLGKKDVVDMLTLSLDGRGSRRYGTPEGRLRGVSLFVDVPVRTMVCDAIVHRDLFPDSDARLLVFNPGARGPANPNDPAREIDRINESATPELVSRNDQMFELPEVPRYAEMIERVASHAGHDMRDFRVYRLRIAYPVICFQYVVAFEAPLRDAE